MLPTNPSHEDQESVLEALDERSLVAEVLSGSRLATEHFVKRFQADIGRIIAGRVPSCDVEDILHTVFMNALKALPDYSFQKPLIHWLSRIATCRCYDYWRKKKRRSREIPASALSEYQQWATELTEDFSSPGYIESEALNRARELTDWALSKLSAEERTVVVLVHLEGYSSEEAAELLNWTAVNVRVRAYRGRKRLRKILAALLTGEE